MRARSTRPRRLSAVVAGGRAAVLEAADAALDPVAQGVEGAVDARPDPAGAAHGDHGHRVARLGAGPDASGVVARVARERRRGGPLVAHHEAEAAVIGGLARA